MTPTRSVLERLRSAQREDAGFSLMETLVAMVIFGIFMALAMGAIISMLTSTAKSQSLQDGSASLENVFQKLDHQVRYSNAISTPNTTLVNGSYFVEWMAQPLATSPQTCTQLRFNPAAGTLQERTWQPAATPVVATGWTLMAKNVTTAGFLNPYPFAFSPSDGTTYAHQQLAITLATQPGAKATARSTRSELTVSFSALNSTKNTSSLVCTEVARS